MSSPTRGTSRPPPRDSPKPSRSYRWIGRPPTAQHPFGILSLTVGKETTAYFVQAIASDFGRAFALTKLDDPAVTIYHVLLDGERSTCDCKGFERHRRCKHRDALAALHQAGQLPMPASPTR